MTLMTKYHPLDAVRSIRRALPIYFGVLMGRRNRPGALLGGSVADLPCGHECEPHFYSLDGSSVLSCGQGSGQGQVVNRGEQGTLNL
jgi:hypothetical protein